MGCICISVFSIVLLSQFLASSLNCITYFYTRVCCKGKDKDAKSEEKQPKESQVNKKRAAEEETSDDHEGEDSVDSCEDGHEKKERKVKGHRKP